MEDNEVTLKIKGDIEDFYTRLKEKGFKKTEEFFMDDIYFIPENLNMDLMSTREILSKAILVRHFIRKSGKETKMITYKIKNYDDNGNIISQSSVNCNILNIDDAKKLLNAIGYQEIMNIKENDCVYKNNEIQFAVKDIENGDKLIEAETTGNNCSIEELKNTLNKIDLPLYTDDFFIKKAEVELNKILKRG